MYHFLDRQSRGSSSFTGTAMHGASVFGSAGVEETIVYCVCVWGVRCVWWRVGSQGVQHTHTLSLTLTHISRSLRNIHPSSSLFLEGTHSSIPEADIHMYISAPGGVSCPFVPWSSLDGATMEDCFHSAIQQLQIAHGRL